MKKILAGLCILGLVFLFGQIQSVRADDYQIDQSCASGNQNKLKIADYTSLAQEFKPSKNRLTRVSVYLFGTDSANLRVMSPTNQTLTGATITADGEKWISHTFSAITVTPGQSYKILLSGASGANIYWYYGGNDCYADGVGYANDVSMSRDLGFATYGYTYTEPTGNTNTNSGNTNTNSSKQTGITTGTNEAPAATTSANIKVPSELKAEDVAGDKGGSIKLTWKVSATTNIDGYKIFRSEQENSGFKNIAKSTKTTLTYTDTNATTGKTFYYMVRAYKGKEESASSNTASAASVDNSAVSPTEKVKNALGITDIDTNIPIFTWYNILAAVLVLVGLGFLIYRVYITQYKNKK